MSAHRVGADRAGAAGVGAALLALAALSIPTGLAAQETSARPVPARFDADLVEVVATSESGREVVLCTDTGGGVVAVRERSAREAGWLPADASARSIPFPAFREGATVPEPRGGTGRMRVVPDTVEVPLAEHCDGMLGAAWFADRTWTLDYPRGRLLHHPDGLPSDLAGRRVQLGFAEDSLGERVSHFPRLDVVVDGDSLPLLLDTGAQLLPTDSARRALDHGDRSSAPVATSFIAGSVFDRWRQARPGWRVVPNAGRFVRGLPMIRVPSVEIAGHEVGPVWFTRRPDRAFERTVDPWMDRPVVGALGGSALRYLRLTISYPEGVAVVSRPGG